MRARKKRAKPSPTPDAPAPEPEDSDGEESDEERAPLEFEFLPYQSVITTSAGDARRFFGAPPDCRVDDAGPVPEDRRDRYKPEARVFHVYPDQKQDDEPDPEARTESS
jgi:hypothetical protein